METHRVRAIVRGRVQGVGFRASTQQEARLLGLSGWVRNLPDGAVELEAEGPRAAVQELLSWCAKGPLGAFVSRVESHWLTAEEMAQAHQRSDAGFQIRH